MNDLNFRHRYIPSSPLQTSLTYKHNKDELRKIKDHKLGSVTLLLLHGTGGNEDDLIPLGQKISPSASLLSPRGKVLENGMPRFFKRLSEGVFDFEDLKYRTRELSDFVKKASNAYGFDLALHNVESFVLDRLLSQNAIEGETSINIDELMDSLDPDISPLFDQAIEDLVSQSLISSTDGENFLISQEGINELENRRKEAIAL